MKLVTREEYNNIMSISDKEMTILAKHEGKNSYSTRMGINSCYTCELEENLQLFLIFTPLFLTVIEQHYPQALKEKPTCFGTYNAKDIISALYEQAQKTGCSFGTERYVDCLSNECFCLLICKDKTEFSENILRIDLFRKLDKSKMNPEHLEFTGGLFHALKHFSIGKQSASIFPNQNVSLDDIEQLISPIAKSFFESIIRGGNKRNTYKADIIFFEKKLTTIFYREEESHVSFVNSVIPK